MFERRCFLSDLMADASQSLGQSGPRVYMAVDSTASLRFGSSSMTFADIPASSEGGRMIELTSLAECSPAMAVALWAPRSRTPLRRAAGPAYGPRRSAHRRAAQQVRHIEMDGPGSGDEVARSGCVAHIWRPGGALAGAPDRTLQLSAGGQGQGTRLPLRPQSRRRHLPHSRQARPQATHLKQGGADLRSEVAEPAAQTSC